jgi:hypothetical protein
MFAAHGLLFLSQGLALPSTATILIPAQIIVADPLAQSHKPGAIPDNTIYVKYIRVSGSGIMSYLVLVVLDPQFSTSKVAAVWF